ncbi:hypothetical protein B0O80DRAFT_422935 [Mortierella sp. GBAus27b]|nr:hypothetical protein B0O80DRAFT_422935 [Mortierella sp. GBAus27b]
MLFVIWVGGCLEIVYPTKVVSMRACPLVPEAGIERLSCLCRLAVGKYIFGDEVNQEESRLTFCQFIFPGGLCLIANDVLDPLDPFDRFQEGTKYLLNASCALPFVKFASVSSKHIDMSADGYSSWWRSWRSVSQKLPGRTFVTTWRLPAHSPTHSSIDHEPPLCRHSSLVAVTRVQAACSAVAIQTFELQRGLKNDLASAPSVTAPALNDMNDYANAVYSFEGLKVKTVTVWIVRSCYTSSDTSVEHLISFRWTGVPMVKVSNNYRHPQSELEQLDSQTLLV